MKLFFRRLGAGKPLIILHGVFGNSDNWLTISKKIAERYEVFLLDQRNHGQSPHSEVFDYQAMTDDLLEFVEEHQLIEPIIVGHSMGGKVAMSFALQYPEKTGKLVVVDIAPRAYPPHHEAILKGLKNMPLAKLTTRQEADDFLSEYVPELSTRQFLLKNLYRDESGKFAWRINLPVIDRQMPVILGNISSKNTFDKPTLFMGGELSKYIQPPDYEQIRALFPKASIRYVKGAGHWVQAEKPKEFLEELFLFL
ncbi:MAG: alpha/beta fold hydrolase [Flammeovirgaceae bacterium]